MIPRPRFCFSLPLARSGLVLSLLALTAALSALAVASELSLGQPSAATAFEMPTAAPPTNKAPGPGSHPELDISSIPSNPLVEKPDKTDLLQKYQRALEVAREHRQSGHLRTAENTLLSILNSDAPEEIKRSTLLELAGIAQQENQLTRAQQIYAQYTQHFPQDPSVPEVYLRQGILYRQMGAPGMALSKFYAVMHSALNLKLDRLEYYQRLVLHAKIEIAETYYLQGDFAQSAEFLKRLLREQHPDLDKTRTQAKLIRALSNLNRNHEVEAQAVDFLKKYPGAPEEPEIRFLLASALKLQGRMSEALQQVLLLLQSQHATASTNPENWFFWQQRTGNEIANYLYKSGDYIHALEIYLHLVPLNPSIAWQFPALYQVGLVYEKLEQPEKAVATYDSITAREKELETAGTPGLKAILEMAKWRRDFLSWQLRTQQSKRELTSSALPSSTFTSSP